MISTSCAAHATTYALTWHELCVLADEFNWKWREKGRWAIISSGAELVRRGVTSQQLQSEEAPDEQVATHQPKF